ncbi:MAG: hypothetical protein C5B54_10720 [Acidobacteria bacterium]|nr:MAG: hypothetical protein C5B54_10720 [Acidobacteriota bacterium]
MGLETTLATRLPQLFSTRRLAMRKGLLIILVIIACNLISTSFAIADFHNACAFTWISCGNPSCSTQVYPPNWICQHCPYYSSGSPNFIKWGDYTISMTDLQLQTVGPALKLERTYHSAKRVDGISGMGWSSLTDSRVSYVTYLFAAPNTYQMEADVFTSDGILARFSQNQDGTFTPPLGDHDTLAHNGDGTWDLTPVNTHTKYHYANTGELQSITDDFGNVQSWTYASGRLQRITDIGSARYLNFFYGADGRVSAVQDSGGRQVQYFYDSQGLLSSVIDPANRTTTYSYTPARFVPLLSQIEDNWNRVVTTMTYLPSDQLSTYTENGETYTYSYGSGTATKSDTSGHTWTYTYDSNGMITSRVGPTNTADTFNPDGSVQMHTDESGIKTLFTYNSNFAVASVTRDYQGPLAIRFDYTYDPVFPNKVTSITPRDPSTGTVNLDWRGWRFDYYQNGSNSPSALKHVYRVHNDGSTLDTLATLAYNSAGQVISYVDATGSTASYAYDGSGDLISATYPRNSDSGANLVYQYGHDSFGRATSVTDPLSHVTSFVYDNLDRMTSFTIPKPSASSPLNFTTAYSYDNFDMSSGLLFATRTDPNARIVQLGYDQFGQLGKSVDSLGNVTTFIYSKGLLTTSVDPNGNATNYTYMNGLIYQVMAPLSETVKFSHASNGIFQQISWPNHITTTIVYDTLNRPAQEKYTSDTLLFGARTINFTYTGQKLTQVSEMAGLPTYDYTYDSSYRVAGMNASTPSAGHIDYTYDAADRVASYSVQGHASATKTYYPDGSLNTITWSPVAGNFKYTYTLDGQYSSILFPDGQHRDFTYDDQGRLLQLTNSHPTRGTISSFAYGYDVDNYTGLSSMLGQRTSLTVNIPPLGFTNSLFKYYYDGNYQLTRADYPNVAPFNGEIDSWTYDAIGNRLTNTTNGVTANYSYALQSGHTTDRLLGDGSSSYTYDGAGNITAISGPASHTFDWLENNKLAYIDKTTNSTSYAYDYLSRRVVANDSQYVSTFVYDGRRVFWENQSNGSVVKSTDFLFGPGMDEPLALSYNTTISGTVYQGMGYYDVDGLGSVWGITDPAGPTNSYVYDTWGKLLNQTNEFSFLGTQPFNYTAREIAPSGLIYNRARFNNPVIGRFISEDPVLWRGGSSNFYPYTGNDPVNFIDPLGLINWETQWWADQFVNDTDPRAKFGDVVMGTFAVFAPDTIGIGVDATLMPDPSGINAGVAGNYFLNANKECETRGAYGYYGAVFGAPQASVEVQVNIAWSRNLNQGATSWSGPFNQVSLGLGNWSGTAFWSPDHNWIGIAGAWGKGMVPYTVNFGRTEYTRLDHCGCKKN